MELIAINPNTGEVKGEIAFYRTHEQQEQYLKIKYLEKYKLRGNRPYVSCYHDSIKDVTQHLSLTESGGVMKLLLYMKLNADGLLQKDGKPLKQLGIQNILGKSKRQTVEIVKRLEFLSILKAVKVGRTKFFYINEHFHVMGRITRKSYFTKLLTNKLREVVEDLRLEQLGFLYKVLPYFHYNTCVLAHNPDETDEQKIRSMNRKELAIAINYDVDNITPLVKQLRQKGLVMTTYSNGNVLYYIHPDLMYRQANDGNKEQFNTLRGMFMAHQLSANRRIIKIKD
ncbi:hypothetical protein [Bacillus sp. T33-2]|uniref:hypothetical protein n=1 Tax=Bacillus sp. T33-2 TaxID=2054168 RepID=UPI000C78833F|nr:hypothetical protein [Bacillus sp. T33-2]PLR98232.1 hypothetical protein CVD19_06470 [Bacillus sp. T33-2]